MILPVGPAHDRQMLNLVTKGANGGVSRESVLPVAFVPMVQKPISDEAD
mgnify:FL=1